METAAASRKILVAIKRVVDSNVRIRMKPDGSGVVVTQRWPEHSETGHGHAKQ